MCEDIVRAPDEWVRWRGGRGRREGERRRERKGRRCCVCCDIKKTSEEMEVAKRELVGQQGYGDSYDYTILAHVTHYSIEAQIAFLKSSIYMN